MAGRWGSVWDYKVDSVLTFSAQEEWVYPKMSDAYVGTDHLRLGFVKEDWASFEEDWRLGLYNPRFMNNKLTGGQGGLFGIHLNGGPFLLSLLPVNIPELGPQYEEKDGQLISRNPWFGEKPETLTYNDVTAPIRYDVNMPPLRDIVLKPGVALRYEDLFWGWYRPRLSAAYKPMPQILLNFPADGRFIIGSQEQYFSVEVQPLVAYHTLISTDQEFIFNRFSKLRLSLAHEKPHLPDRPATWVTQEIGEATFLSSRLEAGDQTKVFLTQLKVWGGDQPDRGRYATDETFFEMRQFFKEAYGLGVETNFFFKKRLRSELSFIYDVAQKGGVFATRHDLFLKKDLRISAVLELLGLVGEDNPMPDGFLSRYRANDRAEIGVSYAF